MKNQRGFALIEIIIVVVLMGIFIIVPLAFWTDNNLEFWLSYFKGRPIEVPYFYSFLLTLFTNVFGILGNVLAELGKLLV